MFKAFNFRQFTLLVLMLSAISLKGQTILNFPLTANNTPAQYSAGNAGCRIQETASGSVTYNSTNGATVSGWDNGTGSKCWYTSAFNTIGFQSVKLYFQMKSTTSGPKNFDIQFSLDNNSWNTIENGNILLTTTLKGFGPFNLPENCSNGEVVYIRFIMTSDIAVNGLIITNSGTSSIKGLVISGNPPITPSAQASYISFTALDTNLIKVAFTKGNGERRIIKMNTENEFTTPADNSLPTVFQPYTSGEQTVYNGTESQILIQVPDVYEEYYFRIYEYNYNNGMTRYLTNSAPENPKHCLLERIEDPAINNIGLNSACLGANIISSVSGSILGRGILYDIQSGISTDSPGLIYEDSETAGPFTVCANDLPRSSTIFFRGFVVNGSGVSLTEESSFDNIPEFTGEGYWSNAERWDVGEVPGMSEERNSGSRIDCPVIHGNCILDVWQSVHNLTVGSEGCLQISPGARLSIEGELINEAGENGLILKSGPEGSGSLIHFTPGVEATIERYLTGTNGHLEKHYHLVSVPLSGETYLSEVWLDSYIFTYLEPENSWFAWNSPTSNVMPAREGLLAYYPYGTGITYRMSGILNAGEFEPGVNYSGEGFGFNLIPNPYPSAIDWDAEGWIKSGVAGTIWGYNPHYKNYGTWNGETGTNSVSGHIPMGQAFFVRATSPDPVLLIGDAARIHSSEEFLKTAETVANVLRIRATASGGMDELAIQLNEHSSVFSADAADALKLFGDEASPQVASFTMSDPALLSINALPPAQGITTIPLYFSMGKPGNVSFQTEGAGNFESGFTLNLEDRLLNTITDLRNQSTYSFVHEPGTDPYRFRLHFGGISGMAETTVPGIQIYACGKTVYFTNISYAGATRMNIVDPGGRIVRQLTLNQKESGSVNPDLMPGIYIVSIETPSGISSHKIVIN